MVEVQSQTDSLDATRGKVLFEWTFAILVTNLTIQFYRLVAQFVTFLFDIFKLTYGVELFWPLTTDDLRPYTHYFTTQNEIIYKLIESSILTFSAFYAARSILNGSIVGLVISFLLYFLHVLILIMSSFFLHDINLLLIEFWLWLATLIVEILSLILIVTFFVQLAF